MSFFAVFNELVNRISQKTVCEFKLNLEVDEVLDKGRQLKVNQVLAFSKILLMRFFL